MPKGSMIIMTISLFYFIILSTVPAAATLTISPSTAVPGGTLKFSYSGTAPGKLYVSHVGTPWSTEQVSGGAFVSVTFNKSFPVPPSASPGSKFCFVLMSIVSKQFSPSMPQPIGEQVCVIVISPDAMKKTTAAAAGPMAAAQLCPDPMVKLTATKSLVGGTATINLTGTVCNSGAMEYNGKDSLDAFFMVYTWHPPKTAAQEHDLKDISHKPIGNKLTKGECKTVTQTFTISNVAAWNHVATQKPSRQAVKQFVFGVDKKYPIQAGDSSFTRSEDCNVTNNRAEFTVSYMELTGQTVPKGVEPASRKTGTSLPAQVKPGERNWLNPQPEPPSSPR